jgi:hypothetical protein
MANLKQAGAQRLAKLSKRPDLPPWWRPLSYVLLVAFTVYLGVSALSSEPPTPLPPEVLALLRQDPATAPATPADRPAPSPPTDGGTTPPDDAPPAGDAPEPPAGGDVVVATVQGGSATVPAAAYDTARAAARALFTGEFGPVPLAASAAVPTGLPRYADPVLGVTLLELSSEGRLVFSTLVDPDGAGPELARPVTVSVVAEASAWRFAGFGF